MYCLNKADGKIVWNFPTLRKMESSPVIAQNSVVIASEDGRLYILDLETGHKIWSYEIGSPVYSTPAVTNNYIIVGADDGKIYVFGK